MAEPGAERRLAAIVAIDVAGYSRLMGADEVGTLATLKAHRAVTDPISRNKGGRIVGTAGDGLLLEFPSVVAAVSFAVETQSVMAERNADIPDDQKMLYRIGINLGDVLVDGEEIYGDGVNVAARIEGLAEPGGVCVSRTVHENVRDKMDIAFDDMGEVEVKNIARPVHVWSWVAEGQAAASPAGADGQLPLPDKPSIAVLPFDNMSGDPEQEYFSDGIAEDIITALSKFRWLFVIARNSTFTYKGRAVQVIDVGRELGVRYVVEGSVRKAGNRIRITAQLIDAANGNHIWAERYDRDISDIFDLQDEITETIVGAVEPEIGDFERERIARKRPENLATWELFQRGLSETWRMDSEGLRAGVDLFRQAIDKDKAFAQPYSYLAFALLHQAYMGFADDPESAIAEATARTHESLALDNKDSLAHAILARIRTHDRQYDLAIREAQQAVRLNPNYAFGYYTLGLMYSWANRPEEGLEPVNRAIRLSPTDQSFHLFLTVKGVILTDLERLDEAFELLNEACLRPHGDFRMWMCLARCAAAANRMAEASEAAAMMLKLRPDFTITRLRGQWHSNWHPELLDSFERQLIKLGVPLD